MRIIKSADAILLALAAVFGLCVVFMDFIGKPFEWLKDTPSYSLLLLALLSLAIVTERIGNLRRMHGQLGRIEKDIGLLRQSGVVQVLSGYAEIYEAGIVHLPQTRQRIRAVVSAGAASVPDGYRNKLAEVLALSKKRKDLIYNDVIVAVPHFPLNDRVKERFAERDAFYARKGISDQIRLYFIANRAVFDMLIIDEVHAFLSFVVVEGASHVQSGLAFINQPAIAKDLAKWFDEVLKPSTVQSNNPAVWESAKS